MLLPQGTASIVQILRAKELPHGGSDRMDHPEVFQKFLIVIGKVLVRGFGARKLRLPSPAGYSPRAQDRRLRRRQVHRDAIHVPEVRTVDVFGFDARSEEHTSELQSLMR